MRQILAIGLVITAMIKPTGIYPQQSARAATVATATIAPLQLNLNSHHGVERPQETDFALVVLEAKRRRIEAEKAKLKIQSEAIAKILAQNGFKPEFAAHYLDAQNRTGTPWQLTASVHKIESGQRGDTAVTSYAGAQGPMQFMPGTWRAYALDGDGDSQSKITDVDDAILTGANYLRAGGADRGDYTAALFTYNHSLAYVNKVLTLARQLGL
jgi:soluble lytic murein transglycosylase-like protein